MRPSLSLTDQMSVAPGNPKGFAEFGIADAFKTLFAKIANVLFGQYRQTVEFAILVSKAAFGNAILRVFLPGSKEQMEGVSAARVVAGMTDLKITGIDPVVNEVSQPVSVAGPLPEFLDHHSELAVTAMGDIRLPFPASIRTYFYFLPEAINILSGQDRRSKELSGHSSIISPMPAYF